MNDLDHHTSLLSPHLSEKALKRRERKAQKRSSPAKPNAPRTVIAPLQARNKNQSSLIAMLYRLPVIFAMGPAGVGKTYLAARVAISRLKDEHDPVTKIIVTRSTAAPKRHQNGFLPGSGNAKMRPWLIPIFEGFKAELGNQLAVDKMVQSGLIEIVSFEHMRGRSFDGCMIICDEGQNLLYEDLRTLITRIGEDSVMTICGDAEQSDIGDESGLERVAAMVEAYSLTAGVVRFADADVVRSAAAKEWVMAFRKEANFSVH